MLAEACYAGALALGELPQCECDVCTEHRDEEA